MRLTEDNIADYADTLVLQVRAGGHTLDYSEASVATLEAMLSASDAQMQAPDFPEGQRSLVVFYNGCYLGEVMARNLAGVWRFDEADWANSSLVFPYRDGGLQVHPFRKLYRRVTEGPAENDLVAYYAGLKEKLEDAAP
jgi:hypothetical protein